VTAFDDLLPAHAATAAEMAAIGGVLARRLGPGDVVLLDGDLGTGKTTLVRGICAELGVPAADVQSPTFALQHTYCGRFPIAHMDLYRVEDPAELAPVGLDLALHDEAALVLVEWPAIARKLWPPHAIRLRLTLAADGTRLVEKATEP
jgi:tRNA threonylcarbamoyladenosine biosynthesis protein TsaE